MLALRGLAVLAGLAAPGERSLTCLAASPGAVLAGVMVALLALGLLCLARRGRGPQDRERIADDLRRRGAVLVRLQPNSAGDGNERGYEVVFHLGDAIERTAVCKTNAAQGVWWQGAVPPLVGDADAAGEQASGAHAASAAGDEDAAPSIVAEPAGGVQVAAEALEPDGPVPDVEDLWDKVEDAREYEGAVPEAPPAPVASLIEVLRGGESRACERAVAELARHGPAALPELESALRDPDPDLRVDVKKAIALIRGG